MINPAIKYKEKMDSITSISEAALDYWNELYEKCQDECTHKHEDGSSSLFQNGEGLPGCWYCFSSI